MYSYERRKFLFKRQVRILLGKRRKCALKTVQEKLCDTIVLMEFQLSFISVLPVVQKKGGGGKNSNRV